MRKKLTEDTEASVLSNSRRRCCVCYGLDRSTAIVQGQIAHLDHDPSNGDIENLTFLCFNHHDLYDSKTSQSKGLKRKEILRYRKELYLALGDAFSQEVHFGKVSTAPSDPYAGKYTRLGTGSDSAEILLTPLPDDIFGHPRYFMSGFALAGSWNPGGPNMGDMSFVIEYQSPNNSLHRPPTPHTLDAQTNSHKIELSHDGDILIVREEFSFAPYGAGVTFSGTYKKFDTP